MTRISTITIALLFSTTGTAALAEGYYVKLYGGVSNLQDTDVDISTGAPETGVSFDGGTLFGGAVGYDYPGTPLAAELEYTYRSGDSAAGATEGGDFASTSVMLNAVWSFGETGTFTPYVGAGLGLVTEIDFDVPLGGGGEEEFNDRGGIAAQAFAGVSYAITDNLSAFGELRYFDAGSRELVADGGATLNADYSTLDVLIGASFSF